MNRYDFWSDFINSKKCKFVTEIGVWRGEFAEQILHRCPSIEKYYLVDPWKHLEDWNKPFNKDDDVFEEVFEEARRRTAPFSQKCVFLRGRTIDCDLPSVDFTYVDGDHTLRGIILDLVSAWPKTRWLGGDDFGEIWQHSDEFEPSMVNPCAAHFAEAFKAPFQVFGSQYLIGGEGTYEYSGDTSLLPHVRPGKATWVEKLMRR